MARCRAYELLGRGRGRRAPGSLLSAHRKAAKFRGDAAVRSWLHTIVVNACLDRIRRNKSRSAFSLSSENAEEPRDHRDYAATVDMSLTVRNRHWHQLPPEQRAAVVAVDVEGYPVAEAAERLGVPVGTVKSRCAARASVSPPSWRTFAKAGTIREPAASYLVRVRTGLPREGS